jgi:16S rRNA (uracil1498-N3)-methyltransferase
MTGDVISLDQAPGLGQEYDLVGPARAALASWKPRLGLAVTVIGPGAKSYRARITGLSETSARVVVFEAMTGPAESRLEIILLQAFPDKERMELIIEKATELGVALIVPWKADKGIGLEEREARQPKAHRFAARALKASRQCRRARAPVIAPVSSLEQALQYAERADLKIALWEKGTTPLGRVIPAGPVSCAALLVGPEGGITEREIRTIESRGFIPVGIGPRILRTETAAIAGVAILQFRLGDLGPDPDPP